MKNRNIKRVFSQLRGEEEILLEKKKKAEEKGDYGYRMERNGSKRTQAYMD